MNLGEARSKALDVLSSIGVSNPFLEADFILEWVMGTGKSFIHSHPEYLLNDREEEKLKEILDRRSNREPWQYIAGEAEFWGLPFKVGPGCLVPRPDTEVLVEAALEVIDEGVFIDWGTGSGCITAALLSERPTCRGIAVDSSARALWYAWQNFKNLDVLDRVLIWHSSGGWDLPKSCEKVDLIVSNPPYIPTNEIPGLMPEVRLYEPLEALDGGSDGLKFYRFLFSVAEKILGRGGYLALEVGSSLQCDRLSLLGGKLFQLVDVKKDLSGMDRVMVFKRRQT